MIDYSAERRINARQFVELLERSTLAERRPVDDPHCIEGMLKHANLLITAWKGEQLIGVARSVTDFTYCCYLSDLAVDRSFQRQSVGRQLIQRTKKELGPKCKLILLSAPAAESYYPHIGFQRHESAWILHEDQQLK